MEVQGNLLTTLELVHCFEEPPKWFVNEIEKKVLYQTTFPDAAKLLRFVEIATYKNHVSRDFYLGAFQLMIGTLRTSHSDSIMALTRYFINIKGIPQAARNRP